MATIEERGSNVRLIFVYGTLKRGFHNHTIIEQLTSEDHAKSLGSYTTVGSYPLVIGPHGIPYLINRLGSGHRISGEVYLFSETGLGKLDEFEGIKLGHYERLPLTVVKPGENGARLLVDADAYFAHRDFGENLWKRCGEKGYSEYSEEMGSKYVIKEDRQHDSSVVQDIKNFISEAN